MASESLPQQAGQPRPLA